MARKKLFVSFDYDNDKVLYEFIIGQAKLPDLPFSISDHSLKESEPERNWEAKALAAIRRADTFVVMVGPKTRYARGVKKEIAMAVRLGKPRVQIIGYRTGTSAWAVPGAGRVYRWNWNNLKRLLA